MFRATVLSVAAILASGCSTRVLLSYSPTTAAEIGGEIDVRDFEYAQTPPLKDDELRTSALGSMHLIEPVGSFVATALRKELLQAGTSVGGSEKCRMEGTVNDFFLDDLGFSIVYKTDITYSLDDEKGNNIYRARNISYFESSKVNNMSKMMQNINESVSENLNKILYDKRFFDAVKDNCE